MWSFKGLLAKIAPASIMLETLYEGGKLKTVFKNLYQSDYLPLWTLLTYKTFSMNRSNILPSVPTISMLSERIRETYEGKSRRLSFVPENPMQLFTLIWSQLEVVIEDLNWVISFKNTQFFSQYVMNLLFRLKAQHSLSTCEVEWSWISSVLVILRSICSFSESDSNHCENIEFLAYSFPAVILNNLSKHSTTSYSVSPKL